MGISYTTLGVDTPDIAPGAVTPDKLAAFTTTFMVNDDGGDDSNDGLRWVNAFKTIQAGLDAVDALEARGKGIVLVAPGGYSEDLVLPTNAHGPFGQLIAVNPTGEPACGAVYLSSTDPANPILTVRARGWLIDGFEFDLPAGALGAAAIVLDKETENANPDYTHIRRCHLVGGGNSRLAIDFKELVLYAIIEDCQFEGIYNASDTGEAISNSAHSLGVPRQIKILRNKFQNNNKHISLGGAGSLNESLIEENHLLDGLLKTPTKYLDMFDGPGYNVVRRNVFAGTYSIAGGYKAAAATDIWVENYDHATLDLLAARPGA